MSRHGLSRNRHRGYVSALPPAGLPESRTVHDSKTRAVVGATHWRPRQTRIASQAEAALYALLFGGFLLMAVNFAANYLF